MVNGITQDLNVLANGTNTNNDVFENPDGVLDKDAFMKLLLVELQHQDPTEPMDSDKILTQTSQLATLESANNTNKAMEELVDRLNNSMDMGALSAIGKMASLGTNAITLQEGQLANFEVYFPDEIQNGTLNILDVNGNTVKTVSLADQAGKSGVLAFQWDGTNSSGEQLDPGNYYITADYTNANGEAVKTQFGVYPIESVRYEDGKPMMKIGSSYVPMEYIKEFY